MLFKTILQRLTTAKKPVSQRQGGTLKPALEGDGKSPRTNTQKKTAVKPATSVPTSPNKSESGNPQSKPPASIGTTNAKLAIFDQNVKKMQQEQQNNRDDTDAKPAPKFIKPTEQARLKRSLLLADGGKEGAASGEYRVNPKTNKLETRERKKTTFPKVPAELSKSVEIISSMPTDFDFKDWNNKPAMRQQKELQKAGLNPADQMTLLNSKVSLDTLAVIVDISRNGEDYGLSNSQVSQISDELLQLSNARVGALNHDLPLGEHAVTRSTFLKMLDEKEQGLLASFGYGVSGQNDPNYLNSSFGAQISGLLSGDDSISSMLHGDDDVLGSSNQFFGKMSELNSIIDDIKSGKIKFDSPQYKEQYVDYLTSEYDKNSDRYRQLLANKIVEANLLQYPETQLKQLVSDLSVSQLEVFSAQLDLNGARKLSRPHNFEELMKELLSDQDSALNLFADEKKSPIKPHVWNGMDIANENDIRISGYYYKKGRYYTKLTCGRDYMEVDLGSRIPANVAIDVSGTTEWEMFGEQIGLAAKMLATPAMIADGAYAYATQSGVPAFLPENLSPSDVPYLGEALDAIDPWDHTAHLTKETISIHLVTHHRNSSVTEDNIVRFKTYKG